MRNAVLLGAVLLVVALTPVTALAQGQPLRVLFLTRGLVLDEQYGAQLAAKGFLVDQVPLTRPLRLWEMKSYNLVIIPDFLTLDDQYRVGAVDVPDWWDVNLPNLREYVEAGGGLLVTSFFNEAGEALCAALDRMLGPWGAGFKAQQILDPDHIASVEGMGSKIEDRLLYCYTENVARHPVTEGVRRIYYPVVNLRWDDCYTTPPVLLYDRAWTPVVRAMRGAYNAKADKQYQWQEPLGNDDVICAVRSVGRGRVALLSLNSYYTFYRPYTQDTSLGENHHGRIDGVVLSGGDGVTPSDGGRLLENLYRWLAEPGVQAGGRGVTPRRAIRFDTKSVLDWDTLVMPPTWRHRPIPANIGGQQYWDEHPDPTITGELQYFKALIGVHSAYSDGKGSVAEYAGAAKKAGYSLIAFTETFEKLGGPERWEALRRDCLRNSSDSFVCLPGIDIADPEGGRYLIFGQPNYPSKAWLSADGLYLTANNVMSLGFTTHLAAIARPGSSPHQYRMFKHYQGIPVATYRGGKQVDDGFEAYAWQVASGSNPAPLAVHEVFSPAEVEVAARTGYQQIMPSDTVLHAADYFRCALSHFFDCPLRYFISEGPILDTWTIFNKDLGKPEENRNRYRIALGATSDVPIAEAVWYEEGVPTQRWTPNAPGFRETLDGYHAVQHHWFMTVTDAQGRRAVSPHLRNVPARYIFRCGDRQNWLGFIPHQYTGTNLPWLDIRMPIEENHEGDGIINGVKGDMLSPMCEFPLSSNRVMVSDWLLGQRYVNADKLTDIAYDAAPMRITLPSKLYEGKVRVSMVSPHGAGPDLQVYSVELKTKMDATRKGEGVWPWFVSVTGSYYPADGGAAQEITPALQVDLQPGDQVGKVVILSAGMRLSGGRLGLIAPEEKTIKAGTVFRATMLVVDTGVAGMARKPLAAEAERADFLRAAEALTLTRGTLSSAVYVAPLEAAEFGIAGSIAAQPVTADLPLLLTGLNPRWVAGVWRSDAPSDFTDQFGFVEGQGLTTLDVTREARFYAGNLVTADNADLYMDLEEWTPERIVVRVNNPTDQAITATVRTPAEITGLKALNQQVTVPPGTTRRIQN